MNSFKVIDKAISAEFEQYFKTFLRVHGIMRKYFYWDTDFLIEEDDLKFEFFELDIEVKEKINEFGKAYFDRSDIYFFVNKYSHRHDLTINNFAKLFDSSNKDGQTQRYEYIKEYIFWKLLEDTVKFYDSELDQLEKKRQISGSSKIDDEIDRLAIFRDDLKRITPIQKSNFLVTYIDYSARLGKAFKNPEYVPFKSFPQYSQILDKLDQLSKNEKKNNRQLSRRLERLYVLKELKDKIHFVFSLSGGAQKEELRELLEVMGDLDSGYFFRGQADASWILEASIKRETNFLKYEPEMYYDILSLKPDAFRDDSTVYDRLITMQHFGMPTRLLDISRNPLIAIFFACNNLERSSNDGLIYIFQPNEKVKLLHFEDDKLQALESIYKKKTIDSEFLKTVTYLKGIAKNQRINNQSGDFIFVGDGDDVLTDLNALPSKFIVIDSSAKKPLLEQLESMNIHAGSVYPDLSHVSKYISEKYKRMTDLRRPAFSYHQDEKEEERRFSVEISPEEFWTDQKVKVFAALCVEYDLKQDESREQVNHFIENGNFQDYKLIGLLNNKPDLGDRESTRSNLKSLLFDFIRE